MLRQLTATLSRRVFEHRRYASSGPRVIHSVAEYRAWRAQVPPTQKVGFVPTMGALHDGHIELVRRAAFECEPVVVSIFVNPKQFAPHEDFDKYPRTLERDVELLKQQSVSVVFAPSAKEMYPQGHNDCMYIDMPNIEQRAEGASRPGFFRGVSTVVTKLFNIVQPSKAFFGQKDGMQCIVVQRLVQDLNMPLEVVVVPTVRESDGLAMSSRNMYLTSEEREVAPILYTSLMAARNLFDQGERDVNKLKERAEEVLSSEPAVVPQYVSVADPRNGGELSGSSDLDRLFVSIAVKLGSTRLIDCEIFDRTPKPEGSEAS